MKGIEKRCHPRISALEGDNMTSALSAFPVTARWVPARPDVLQLYSFPTPNGVKVSIILEETGLPYEAHLVDIRAGDQKTPEFLSLNPNGKIPAILDPAGPGGRPMALWESGAILLWLAEKTGQLMLADPAARQETVQWVMFQMGGLGPMLGQLGWFTTGDGKAIEDPRPRDRYRAEAARLLRVLDARMEGRDWIMGDYSIADIAICPWLRTLRDFYKAGPETGWNELRHVPAWLDRFLDRPAVKRGLSIPRR
jgi:GSH-dependent disulfide-bond oxidoreductase